MLVPGHTISFYAWEGTAVSSLAVHRFQFAFTVTYHYLYPQLTMGLALLILVLKTFALRGEEVANEAVRFWLKIFAVTFVMGVVTGIPLEFQFGTNWARFADQCGGVIGQTLAMEGVFAFFLESSLLYGLLYGEKRLGPWGHWLAALLLWIGTWLSGYFIVCTNAWMQHPVGFTEDTNGILQLESIAAVLTNPWAIAEYSHTMVGAVITGCFTMASIGAFYLLREQSVDVARRFVSVAVVLGLAASIAAAFPTGDAQVKLILKHQPVTFAAMEGHFHTTDKAGLVMIGQPDMEKMELDNPIKIPDLLTVMTHGRWVGEVRGLQDFPNDQWPDNVPLLYYVYHIMVGLGTLFIATMGWSAVQLGRGRLWQSRGLLWVLMLALPFPFIANTAGWLTTELGRQPWLVYGIFHTADGYSTQVSYGNVVFTLLGFMGMYTLLSIFYFFVTTHIIASGPGPVES